MEPDDVLVGIEERCGNEDERNQVFGREAAMLHFVEVAFDYESIENDLDEALDAAVVVQSDTLDKRADDADIRVLQLNRTRTQLSPTSSSSTVVKTL